MSEAEQSQSSEIGLADTARRFSELSESPQAQADTGRQRKVDAEVRETEAAAEYAEETTSDEEWTPEESGSDDDVEADEVADDEGRKKKPLDPNTLVTVKIDGETKQVPLKEALEGYQRQSDYSRNVQAVRQEKQRIEQERAQMQQVIQAAIPILQAQIEVEPDWAQVHRDDPINYPIYRDQWRDRQQQLASLQYEEQRIAGQRQQQEEAAKQQLLVQGREYLASAFSEWKEPEAFSASVRKLRDYGQTAGFSAEELQNVYDPRYVVMLEKARRYDALKADRPKPVRQEGPKPLRGGGNSSNPVKGNDMSRVQQRLKATGHVNDAAAYFSLLDSRRK